MSKTPNVKNPDTEIDKLEWFLRLVGIVVALIVIVVAWKIFGWVTQGGLSELGKLFHRERFAVLAFSLGLVFPLSALAFIVREIPRLMAQLNTDYAMLGMKQASSVSAADQKKDKRNKR